MDHKAMCADRKKQSLRCRHETGSWQEIDLQLATQASMLTEYADPFSAPEVILMRDILRSWRFYDTFRTDACAPARQVSVGTFTPVMSGDGSDLAAALQTIREIGDDGQLDRAVEDAFPGSQIRVHAGASGLQLTLQQPGMLRELTAAELSDGTLRFLLLVAALLTPRPPELLVLNEPENSLHHELIPALGRLIRQASKQSQVIVVSHNPRLVEELESDDDCVSIRLKKQLGETVIENANLLDQYGWKWPTR
jgi:predicted ATPase